MTLACLSLAPGLISTLEERSSFLGTLACLAIADFGTVGIGFLVLIFPSRRLVGLCSVVIIWHQDPLFIPAGFPVAQSFNPKV